MRHSFLVTLLFLALAARSSAIRADTPAQLARQKIEDFFTSMDLKLECEDFTCTDKTIVIHNIAIRRDDGPSRVAVSHGQIIEPSLTIDKAELVLTEVPTPEKLLKLAAITLSHPLIARGKNEKTTESLPRDFQMALLLSHFVDQISEPEWTEVFHFNATDGKLPDELDSLNSLNIVEFTYELPPEKNDAVSASVVLTLKFKRDENGKCTLTVSGGGRDAPDAPLTWDHTSHSEFKVEDGKAMARSLDPPDTTQPSQAKREKDVQESRETRTVKEDLQGNVTITGEKFEKSVDNH